MYFKEYLKKSLCQKIRQIAMVFRNLTEKMRKSLAEKIVKIQWLCRNLTPKGLQYAGMSNNFDALFVLTDFPSKLCMPHQAKVTVEVKEKNHENGNP